ncbi:hypothetical protein IR009_08805 [Pseudomonas putida]|uniref:hypothetical protein n=1 Tax=Pseudomonas putida TaxID=303 RepID=UPI0018AB6A15|nr:hypothetical protein [Pseudomonas putida]MBF8765323.1 hypothetical protein [Pseudomonas putida]
MNAAAKPSKENCIYEDDEIEVFYHTGKSRYLLFTFGDLVTLADGKRFSADVPVKKLGLSCIGFMAKRGNWYPEDSMKKAAESVRSITTGYQHLIGYGGSMGGYASIKFSKLLGLTHSIAFCPQWTIDRKECHGINPGYQSYFKESMSGMGIKGNEISGDVLVVYDPDHTRDAFHANMIKDVYPSTVLQKFRSSDHHVTLILSGSKNLELMLELVFAGDYEGFQCETSKIRRSHPRRAKILLSKASKKHPIFLSQVHSNLTLKSRFDAADLIEGTATALERALKLNKLALASQLAFSLMNSNIEPYRKKLLADLLHWISLQINPEEKLSLRTAHGTKLFLSIPSGKICHVKPSDAKKWHKDIFLRKTGGTYYLAVIIDGLEWLLAPGKSGSVSLAAHSNADPQRDPLIQAFFINTELTLKRLGKFMSCDPNGSVMYDRTEAKAWERFSLES